MKLAYLDIRETPIPFSNPYWVSIIPKPLMSYVQFEREPVTLSHSVAGRYLLWKLLANNYYSGSYDFELTKSSAGKLFFIKNSFHFNISHSGNLVICALSDEEPMGIDIEQILPVPLIEFKNCLSSDEWKDIESSGDIFAFYRLWTMKEAVCKAEGIGLIDDLYNLNPEMDRCIFPSTRSFWYLHELTIQSGYSCHLAVQKKITNLDLKKEVPLV